MRIDNMKEIREEDGTLVITSNDVPAGMGGTQEYGYDPEDEDDDECEDKEKN